MVGESAETIFKLFLFWNLIFNDVYLRSFWGSESNAVIEIFLMERSKDRYQQFQIKRQRNEFVKPGVQFKLLINFFF